MLREGVILFALCAVARGQVPAKNDVTQPVTIAAPLSPQYQYRPDRNPLLNGYYYPSYSPSGPAVRITSYSDERGIDGSYSYSYASADGKQVQESGFVKDSYVDNDGNPQGTQVKEGSFAYVSPEGTPIQINYVADEYGFRPAGFRIPADGKDVVIPNVNDRVNYGNPLYNKYSPFNNGNRYNNYGPYNSRPYDSRYPNGYNHYPFPNQFGYDARPSVVVPKKVTA